MLMNRSSWNLTFFWSLTFFLLECCSTTSAGFSNSLAAHPMAEEMLEPQPPAESTAKRHLSWHCKRPSDGSNLLHLWGRFPLPHAVFRRSRTQLG